MTVLYSNFGDLDTKVLSNIWKDLNAKIFTFSRFQDPDPKEVDEAISNEEDTLIIVGHGGGNGCWKPLYGDSFDWKRLRLVKTKNIVGIWCHASEFAERFNAKGFFSGMFISNPSEARYVLGGRESFSFEDITTSEVKFCNILNDLLKRKLPLKEWKEIIDNQTDKSFPVEEYNYLHTRYFE